MDGKSKVGLQSGFAVIKSESLYEIFVRSGIWKFWKVMFCYASTTVLKVA